MKNALEEFKISLIIPAYNEEKYIGDCLDHVLKNSNGKLFEIIVVNNASTDKTVEIVRRYKQIKIVTENTKGLTMARQRGFIEAKGNLIANIDADTRMPPGWTDKIIEEFDKDKNMVCLSGPYIYHDMSGWKLFLSKVYWVLAMPVYYIVGYMATGGNLVIKKETLERMGGFDTKIKLFGEDTNTARRASSFGKVKFKFNFIMPTSGRRLINSGTIKTGYIYLVQFLSEVLRHKPATQKYTDIR